MKKAGMDSHSTIMQLPGYIRALTARLSRNRKRIIVPPSTTRTNYLLRLSTVQEQTRPDWLENVKVLDTQRHNV